LPNQLKASFIGIFKVKSLTDIYLSPKY
jgi:hypothetical protein